MKKIIIAIAAMSIAIGSFAAFASPKSDLNAMRAYFKKKFPKIKLDQYKDGIYALDKDRREAWKDWMDFAPPFTDALDMGKKLFNKKMKSGKTIGSCFKRRGIGIRQNFPYFDKNKGRVITLEAAINDCIKKNGDKPLKFGKGKLAAISAYMASTSKGKKINIKISNDPRSLAIYERGKRHFYSKRGQLNFACADCHISNAGMMVRGNLLGAVLGQTSHWPTWRRKWAAKAAAKGKSGPTSGLGTLHRRYTGCNKQVRAKPFKPQSDEYTALEYFHAYMSTGISVNGPGLRQ